MPEKLKDLFFTKSSIESFAHSVRNHFPEFDLELFFSLVYDKTWEELELKAKMRHVTKALFKTLPADYVTSLVILLKASPEIKGFEAMTLPDYVECYGMDHWEESLNALGQFTRYSTSEFAIRPYLDKDPGLTMHYMKLWAQSEHENVRRFASEGCRPRLPWAMVLPRFVKDPSPVLEVLELLKNDESLFVRKSVANNLNDISKDHPELVLDTATSWYGLNDKTNWIVKHGLRTLLKKGNEKSLRLFGFGDPGKLHVKSLSVQPNTLKIGEALEFGFELENLESDPCNVRLEYTIDFVKSSGKTSPKVFQISEKEYEPGAAKIKRKHSFANLSTRKHFAGKHMLTVMVNGKAKSSVAIELKA